jgi:periplasmic divalent cation tolerance protein
MSRKSRVSIALVTAPNLVAARVLAKAALKVHLAACANLVPKVESHFWWQGQITNNSEVLLVFKTTEPCLDALEKLIIKKHPYDTPEFIVLSLSHGSKRYLNWVRDSTALAKRDWAKSKRTRVAKGS